MALQSNSKIGLFQNHAPFWQRYPVWVILLCSFALISKTLIYRLRTGGRDMNWADKFGESLFWGIFTGLFVAWPRKGVGKDEQGERQRS
jgi:hypothetical protein